MRIFTVLLVQVLLASPAFGQNCEWFIRLKSDSDYCEIYDKAAIGTFKVLATDSRVTKLHFYPTEVLRGELEGHLELFAEKDECAFWPEENQRSFVLLSGDSKRLSICNAGRINE